MQKPNVYKKQILDNETKTTNDLPSGKLTENCHVPPVEKKNAFRTLFGETRNISIRIEEINI